MSHTNYLTVEQLKNQEPELVFALRELEIDNLPLGRWGEMAVQLVAAGHVYEDYSGREGVVNVQHYEGEDLPGRHTVNDENCDCVCTIDAKRAWCPAPLPFVNGRPRCHHTIAAILARETGRVAVDEKQKRMKEMVDRLVEHDVQLRAQVKKAAAADSTRPAH